jgi:betaine-aldehyde dehydrogenase
MNNYKMWIDGKWTDAESKKTFKVINPATGEEVAAVPLGGNAEVDKSIEAARRAFPTWSRMTQRERSDILYQIADGLEKQTREFAELETQDHGFPIAMSENLVQVSVRILNYAGQCARTLASEVLPVPSNIHAYLKREPIGVNALITPWNSPLHSVVKKVAYSIAVGNTCVVKPASLDCLTALKFAEILEKAGLPAGTVNIITGPGSSMGMYLASHPGVNMVSFTGGSETGKAIMAAASKTVKRLHLELGGKNPFIVLEDADVDKAVASGVMGIVGNSGQVCGSPGRFYIHDKVHDQFVDKFIAHTKRIVVGDPTDRLTQMGPLVSAAHRETVESYIKSGIEEGARLLLGGKRPSQPPLDKGYFVMPTVFSEVKQNMKIAREEIFGPVACIMRFSSEEEVIKLANDNIYGLTASIWTQDTARGMRITSEIEAGSVWVNSTAAPMADLPWGGFKESGIGKEYSKIGFEEVTQMKVVGINIA